MGDYNLNGLNPREFEHIAEVSAMRWRRSLINKKDVPEIHTLKNSPPGMTKSWVRWLLLAGAPRQGQLLPSPIPGPTLGELDHDRANLLQSVGKGGLPYRALEATQQLVDLMFHGQAFGGLRVHERILRHDAASAHVYNTEQAKIIESYANKEQSQSKSMDVELAHSVAYTP
jgi:hypothetical protein